MRTYTERELVEMLRSRITFGMTQQALADQLSINRPTLNAVLHGKQRPTKDIAAALGFVRIDDLYRRNRKPKAKAEA